MIKVGLNGPFSELESFVRTVDVIRGWRQEALDKAKNQQDEAAAEVLASARTLVAAMNSYDNGYRRLCGLLGDFRSDWTKDERKDAEAGFREWIDETTIAREIRTNMNKLQAARPENETLNKLVGCAEVFQERSVGVLIAAKKDREYRRRMLSALASTKSNRTGDQTQIVEGWADETLRHLYQGEEQLECVNGALGFLEQELGAIHEFRKMPPVETPKMRWYKRGYKRVTSIFTKRRRKGLFGRACRSAKQ